MRSYQILWNSDNMKEWLWNISYTVCTCMYVHTIFWYGHAFLLNKVILLFSLIILNSSKWNSFVRFQSHDILIYRLQKWILICKKKYDFKKNFKIILKWPS